MLALLNPRVWVALVVLGLLVISHGFACASGSARTRAKWDAEKVVQQQAQIAAEKAARARDEAIHQAQIAAEKAARVKEQSLQSKVTEAINAASEREKKSKVAAAAARAATDSLRDDLTAARSQLSSASLVSLRSHAATLNAVFGECTREVERLAGAAEGHASDALTFEKAWPK